MSGFYRCEIKVISRGGGQSASAAARYDARANRSDRSDVQSVGSVNLPDWAKSPGDYWAAADKLERANGSLARRAILSFPIELQGPGAREQVIREWLADNCPNMPASWAVHDSGDGNPHAHLLVSERQADGIERAPELWFKRYNSAAPDKGGAKKGDIGSRRKEWLADARESWAEVLNSHLPADRQVDHRSLRDRGIHHRDPQPKFGAKVLAVEQKGIRTRLVSSIILDHAQHCSIRCLTFTDKDGREVAFRAAVEREDRIDLVGKPSQAKCIEIVKACKAKGWATVEVTGSPEFQQMMKAELRKAGIKIQGESNEQNSEHRRGADEGSRTTDGGQGRDGRFDRPAPGRGRYEPDRGFGQRQGRDDGKTGTHDERPTPEAAASPAAPATAVPATGRGRDGRAHADLKSDIRALAGQPDGVPSGQKPGSNMQKDLTAIQVRKQLASMQQVDSFDIGIRDSKSGKFTNVQMDRAGVIESIARLKRENARGCDVYVRPEPSKPHPFILLDDVNVGSIERMKCDGLTPVLEVETSPLNYQVLIKMPVDLDRHVRKATERVLSGRYGSDPNSADGGHYMRLAGFTNRKPRHVQDDGRFPFVKLSVSKPEAVVPTEVWRPLHAQALDRLTDDLDLAPQAHSSEAAPLGGVMPYATAESLARRMYSRAADKWGQGMDMSRADFSVARALLQRGCSSDRARTVLEAVSPDLSARKAGHVDDYIERTIKSAYSSVPELVARDRQAFEMTQKAASKSEEKLRIEAALKADEERQRRVRNPLKLRPVGRV
ncbi:MAG: MobA/MobL family protein [Gallionellaceae bacterium]|nr:MobA/MobL family protein [Gallionellaceae bacterium]